MGNEKRQKPAKKVKKKRSHIYRLVGAATAEAQKQIKEKVDERRAEQRQGVVPERRNRSMRKNYHAMPTGGRGGEKMGKSHAEKGGGGEGSLSLRL